MLRSFARSFFKPLQEEQRAVSFNVPIVVLRLIITLLPKKDQVRFRVVSKCIKSIVDNALGSTSTIELSPALLRRSYGCKSTNVFPCLQFVCTMSQQNITSVSLVNLRFDAHQLFDLFQRLTCLKRIDFYHCTLVCREPLEFKLGHLAHVNLTEVHFVLPRKSFFSLSNGPEIMIPTIRLWNITQLALLDAAVDNEGLLEICVALGTSLQKLAFKSYASYVTQKGLARALGQCPNLTALNLGCRFRGPKNTSSAIIGPDVINRCCKLSMLEELSIEGSAAKETHIESLLKACEKLKLLSVYQCKELPMINVRHILYRIMDGKVIPFPTKDRPRVSFIVQNNTYYTNERKVSWAGKGQISVWGDDDVWNRRVLSKAKSHLKRNPQTRAIFVPVV